MGIISPMGEIVGTFDINTHYYMSMYYDVSAQTLKISYQTDAEFSDWLSLRSISSGKTTTHDLSSGPPTGVHGYTMYLGNTARNYDRPLVGWIDFLEITSISPYNGSDYSVPNSEINVWAAESNNGNRYRNNNAAYHYDNINDGDENTFWISGNNSDETIGVYFIETVEILGFALKWPDTSITTDNVHLRRRGTLKFSFTQDNISSMSEAESALYYDITSPYYVGDPQTDGQENVPTLVYLGLSQPLNATGLKIDITGLNTGVEYSVALGELIVYATFVPPRGHALSIWK